MNCQKEINILYGMPFGMLGQVIRRQLLYKDESIMRQTKHAAQFYLVQLSSAENYTATLSSAVSQWGRISTVTADWPLHNSAYLCSSVAVHAEVVLMERMGVVQ